MLILLFQVQIKPNKIHDYMSLAQSLSEQLHAQPGFIANQRFQSTTKPNEYLSMSIWRDEESIAMWRDNLAHQAAQRVGINELFTHYSIKVTECLREHERSL